MKYDAKETQKGEIQKLFLRYEINCTSGDEVSINYIYLKLPKGIKGNSGPNATIGEALFEKGRYYIFKEAKIFKHNFSKEIEITDKNVLQCINSKKIKKLGLVVNTSKYGDVSSNKVKV